MSRHIKKKFMYRNLMIKGYANLFNVNVLCTDACVWLHTLIYMIKRNPQKCRIPLCTKKIMHSLTHEDFWNIHWKKNQSKLRFSRYMYTNMLAFQGFFLFWNCMNQKYIRNVWSHFYILFYAIHNFWISLCIFHIIMSKRIA